MQRKMFDKNNIITKFLFTCFKQYNKNNYDLNHHIIICYNK